MNSNCLSKLIILGLIVIVMAVLQAKLPVGGAGDTGMPRDRLAQVVEWQEETPRSPEPPVWKEGQFWRNGKSWGG